MCIPVAQNPPSPLSNIDFLTSTLSLEYRGLNILLAYKPLCMMDEVEIGKRVSLSCKAQTVMHEIPDGFPVLAEAAIQR